MANWWPLIKGAGMTGAGVAGTTAATLDAYRDEPWVGALRELMHPDPRNRMGATVEPTTERAAEPGTADFMLPPTAQSWEAEHRYAPLGTEISQGDAYWMSGGRPLPQRSAADAYRMGGVAQIAPMPNWRDIDRQDIEDQYGGADIHGIKLPPVSRDEPKAWFDTLVGETPADAALNWGLGGTGRLAKAVATLGGLSKVFEPDPAEAAPRDPRFWHGISANKLSKPIGEMLAERTPTQVVAERFISPEALQGGVMLPAPGDRAEVGEQLLGVGGKRLDIPTELQGGHGYMPANVDQGHVWASDQGVISTMGDRLKRLRDQYANVYLPYSAMGERSVDFSHHMSDTLSEMVKDAKILKKSKDPDKMTAATFNEAMREPWGDFPKPIEKFPGILSPNLRQWLINAPGKTRSKFAQLLDQAPYQSAGFPDVAEARFAVTDPRLLHEPTGAAGLSISRPDPNVIEPSGHRTYSTALGGDYVGGFERSIPREVMFPDIVKAYAERRTKYGQPFNPSQQDYAFRMGTPPFFQKTDDQWLEGVMRYLEATRNAQR